MKSEREEKIKAVIRMSQPDLTVVLENIFDPLNISAVLRSCDAVGIREIFVIYTRDYLDKRGLVLGKRTSGGAFKWTDVYVFDDLGAAMKQIKQRYERVLAAMPAGESDNLYDLDLTRPTALLFGNEDEGVSPEAAALCDGAFTIPQAGFTESLNISVACAVTLFEAQRQRRQAGFYDDKPRLNLEQQAMLFERWTHILKSGVKRNRGMMMIDPAAEIPPVFVERKTDYTNQHKPLPLTKFDL